MDIALALLPFLILIVFWLFLTRRAGHIHWWKPMQEELAGIRQELERLRRAIEQRPPM